MLPPAEQDALAATIVTEIESEAAWEQRFAATADQLAHRADEAHLEHRAGRTQPLAPERL